MYLTFTAKEDRFGHDVIKSKLNPILWIGKHKEVFFFYEEPAEDEQNENRLYFAELKLEDDSAELKRKTMSSHTILEQIDINCTNKREITNCAAKKIIQWRHKEAEENHYGIRGIGPQAKIDLIEMDGSKVMVISGRFKQAKTTTELLAEQDSLDKQCQFNPSEDPAGKVEYKSRGDYTIFFISMEEQRVIWEIFGGLYFIGFDKEKRIVYADSSSIHVTDW